MSNNLLIVCNFSPKVGYAWNTIQEYFLALGQMFIQKGSRSVICYPELNNVADEFNALGIDVVQFDFSSQNLIKLYRFIKQNQIRIIYLTDRPVCSLKYLVARLAGAKKIIIHGRISSDMSAPGFLKRLIKKTINRYPLLSADMVVAISEFVRKSIVCASSFPENRTLKIWNGINIEKFRPGSDDYVYREYGIPRGKKIVFAYSRANRYKGIQVLIEAADIIIHEQKRRDICFLYCGDGPDLECFRSLVAEKKLLNSFLCPGKTASTARILKGVNLVVVPSLCQEGFGLTVVEGMATGKVVIASKVGGITEIIDDSRDGYLVSPGDSRELAGKILDIVKSPECSKELGRNARQTVIKNFNIADKKVELLRLFEKMLCRQVNAHEAAKVS